MILLAAAASVALLGGVAAMVLTVEPTPRKVVERGGSSAGDSTATMINPEALHTIELAPKTAKRTILDASDRDVIINKG